MMQLSLIKKISVSLMLSVNLLACSQEAPQKDENVSNEFEVSEKKVTEIEIPKEIIEKKPIYTGPMELTLIILEEEYSLDGSESQSLEDLFPNEMKNIPPGEEIKLSIIMEEGVPMDRFFNALAIAEELGITVIGQ